MKKLIIAAIGFLALFLNFSVNAQFNGGFNYERIDSVYRLGRVYQTFETTLNYYLICKNEVYKIDKVNNNAELIYQNSLKSITQSFKDSLGNIGIVQENELKLYNGVSWHTINIPCSSFNIIANALVDFDNNIFLGAGDSLFIYNNNAWTLKKILDPGNNFTNYRMLAGPNHEFRFYTNYSTPTYVFELQGQTAVVINQLHAGYDTRLHYDSSGRLWFSKGGKIYWKSMQNIVDSLSIPNPYNISYSGFLINRDASKIWLTNDYSNDTILYYDGVNWRQLYHNESLSNYYEFSYWKLGESKIIEFALEYSTGAGNLFVYEDTLLPQELPTFYEIANANLHDVLNINQDQNGSFTNRVLIASSKGIIRKSKSVFEEASIYKVWDTNNSNLPSSNVLCMATPYNEYQSDTLYLGTDKGLVVAKIEDDSLIVYRTYDTQNSNLPADTITAIHFVSYDNLWLGTKSNGLIRYSSSGGFTNYTKANSLLPSNHINSLCQDGYLNAFFATTDSGFVRIDNNVIVEQFTPFNSGMIHANISFVKRIYAQTYVGSYGGGLAKYSDLNLWTYYNTTNLNFNTDSIYYIVQANEPFYFRNLIGTNNGIVSFYIDNNAEPVFEEMQIFGSSVPVSNIKNSANFYPCGAFGNKLVSLSNKGILNYINCLSSIKENQKTEQHSFSLIGNKLYLNSHLEGKFQLELYSIDGKNIYNEVVNLTPGFSANLPILSEGIYTVRMSNDSELYTGKVICIQ